MLNTKSLFSHLDSLSFLPCRVCVLFIKARLYLFMNNTVYICQGIFCYSLFWARDFIINFWELYVIIFYVVVVKGYFCLDVSENPASTPEGFVVYKDHILVSWFWWYHVIGLIWTAEFIIACEQLVISEIVTTWFFTRSVNWHFPGFYTNFWKNFFFLFS